MTQESPRDQYEEERRWTRPKPPRPADDGTVSGAPLIEEDEELLDRIWDELDAELKEAERRKQAASDDAGPDAAAVPPPE